MRCTFGCDAIICKHNNVSIPHMLCTHDRCYCARHQFTKVTHFLDPPYGEFYIPPKLHSNIWHRGCRYDDLRVCGRLQLGSIQQAMLFMHAGNKRTFQDQRVHSGEFQIRAQVRHAISMQSMQHPITGPPTSCKNICNQKQLSVKT